MAKYAYQKGEENTAKALGRGLRISPKRAYEVANAIRGKDVEKARALMESVIEKKVAIPFRRHNRGVAHRKGKIGPGAYPVNACTEFLKLLLQVEANASSIGLNTSALNLVHVAVHRGEVMPGRFKGGAHNTPTVNLEYVVKETEKAPEGKKEVKKEEKPVEKKEENGAAKEKKEEKKEKPVEKPKTKNEPPKTTKKESKS